MDSLYVVALVNSNMYSASMHWMILWIFIGFVCSVAFWKPLVRQFTNGR